MEATERSAKTPAQACSMHAQHGTPLCRKRCLAMTCRARQTLCALASHQQSSAPSGPRDHRLPTGSGRVKVQPLPPASPPAALLLGESSQQMIAALRRASACAAQLALATRPGVCTKLYVRQPLSTVGLSIQKAQLCSEYTSIIQGKSSTGC